MDIDMTSMFPAITAAQIIKVISQVVTWGAVFILLWVSYRFIKKNVNSLIARGKMK